MNNPLTDALAMSYGRGIADSKDYDMFPDPDEKRRSIVIDNYNKAKDVLSFVSEHCCIIPKNKLKEWESIVDGALKADHVITEPAWRFMWERLFGKEMFQEEKK